MQFGTRAKILREETTSADDDPRLFLNTEFGIFKTQGWGTSPAIQWLRLCASTAGGMGSIPNRGQRSCMPHGAAKYITMTKAPQGCLSTCILQANEQAPKARLVGGTRRHISA